MRLASTLLLALLLGACTSQAQTFVYLRGGGPASVSVIGCNTATPIVCTLSSVAGLAAGDTVSVQGVCSVDPTRFNVSNANGLRKIGTIVGSTVTLLTLSSVSIAANGAWCNGDSSSDLGGPQTLGKVLPFTLVDGPRGWFDGTNGALTRKWALGLHNGLVSLTCSGGACVGTTSYDHTCVGSGVGICPTDHVRIFNSSSTTLSPAVTGGEYTVSASTAFTFTITGVSMSVSGDVAHNATCGAGVTPNGTIQTGDECMRITQLGVSTSWPWQAALMYYNNFPPSGGAYKFTYQGGGGTSQSTQASGYLSTYGLIFMIDQKNQDALSAALDLLTHVEMMGGNNFFGNEESADGGNYELSAYTNSPYMQDWANGYQAVKTYMTPTQRQTFIDKILNDVADPVPCTKNIPAPIALAIGSFVSPDLTHITLTGGSATPNVYANNTVEAVSSGGIHAVGLVASYNATTKIATMNAQYLCAGTPCAWSNGTVPVSGGTFSVWESSSVSGTTMTGYGTHWNTAGPDQVHVGDYLLSMNYWGGFLNTGRVGSYVTVVNSDTRLTVINGSEVRATATPQTTWISHPWVTGNCGWQCTQNAWIGAAGSQPATWLPRGGSSTGSYGGNNAYPLQAMEVSLYMALADDDPRAITNLAKSSVSSIDNLLGFTLLYSTGLTQSGLNYNFATTAVSSARLARPFTKDVVNFPSLDTSGPWIDGEQKLKMYLAHPDRPYIGGIVGAHARMFSFFGSNSNNVFADGCTSCSSMLLDYGIAFNPNSTSSKYTKYWLDNVMGLTNYSSISSTDLMEIAVMIDPRQQSLDYKVQPAQYFFHATSATTAASFGFPLSSALRADALVSRTKGWSSAADTHLFFRSSALVAIDHDVNQPGILWIYKVGSLLSNDNLIPEDAGEATTDPSFTKLQPVVEFDGANSLQTGMHIGTASISRWAGGATASPYGDPNSNFAYAMADMAGAYSDTLNYLHKHLVHFKRPGSSEAAVTFTAASSPTAKIIRDQVFYPQNGETTASQGANVVYDEGTTTCPGVGGCGSLDTNREVLECEDGNSSNGDPLRQYCLNTHFFSPGAMTLSYDGTSYPSSTVHANRVSIYGGGTVGGTSTSLESMAVHCITAGTTCTASALNPDANWTGVQLVDAVAIFARGGVTHPSMAPVSVTLADPGQVLIGGLTAGAYGLTVGAYDCGTITVLDGDNSAYCETTGAISGPLVLTGVAAPVTGPIVGGKVGVGGKLSVGH